ncbi:uncharacterized protein OCT59_016173 [Rhizophagus irregularis]|uniref:uncharacterized protein n=1 Tax=Rhizophagus irregularis TaxID=588596 RepID=UPI0033248206|nr:hypothetical protein OCT59_016173 [Rhizophagus irregularis]
MVVIFGKSGNTIIDDFIFQKKLRWFPYNKFKNVEYLNEGGFGTIYKAIWLKNNGGEEVILKCHKNLNENLNEFLKEWEYHTNLMKKCWNEDPLKRPSSEEVLRIIEKWIFRFYKVSEELKSNIMEFINAPIVHNNLVTKSHPKACYTSRLLDFTSKKLNEILESENLNDCAIKDLRTLVENTSKLNEILEGEDSQATSVKANEMLVSEDMSDYIIKDLGSLDIKTDEN